MFRQVSGMLPPLKEILLASRWPRFKPHLGRTNEAPVTPKQLHACGRNSQIPSMLPFQAASSAIRKAVWIPAFTVKALRVQVRAGAGCGHSKEDELSVHKGLYTLPETTDQLSLGR